MARMNWSRDEARRLMLSRGVESAREEDTFVLRPLHRTGAVPAVGSSQRRATPAGRRCRGGRRVAGSGSSPNGTPGPHPTSEDRNWRRRHRRGGSRTGGSKTVCAFGAWTIAFSDRYRGRRCPTVTRLERMR